MLEITTVKKPAVLTNGILSSDDLHSSKITDLNPGFIQQNDES